MHFGFDIAHLNRLRVQSTYSLLGRRGPISKTPACWFFSATCAEQTFSWLDWQPEPARERLPAVTCHSVSTTPLDLYLKTF